MKKSLLFAVLVFSMLGLAALLLADVPGYFYLISPANGETGVGANPTLNWSDSAGADHYEVYLGKVLKDGYPPYIGDVTESTYTATCLDVNATYYWRIVAVNDDGTRVSFLWHFTRNNIGCQ